MWLDQALNRGPLALDSDALPTDFVAVPVVEIPHILFN